MKFESLFIVTMSMFLAFACKTIGKSASLVKDDTRNVLSQFNYARCNDGLLTLKNECAVARGNMKTCNIAIELVGTNDAGEGVIKYFVDQGALGKDEVLSSQVYDPKTFKYSEASYVTIRGQSWLCRANESCYYVFNLVDPADFGRGSVVQENGGLRMILKTQDNRTVNWRFERCEMSFINY